MDSALEAHRGHLAALRDACATRPGAHAHQLAALDRLLALASEHDGLLAFRSAGGDGFELARATALDRVANQARVAALVGEPLVLEAAALEYGELLEARGHADWPARIAAASSRGADLRERAATAGVQVTRLLMAVLGVKGAVSEQDAAVWQEHAGIAYRGLLGADPAFGRADLESTPRYALRVPWTGEGRELVAGWLPEGNPREEDAMDGAKRALGAAQARWREGLAQLEAVEVEPAELSVETVTAPYRALAAAATGEDRGAVAVRTCALAAVREAAAAADGNEAAARLASSGRPADLAAAPQRARAQDGLERQAIWPDPLVAQHWRGLLEGLEGAHTTTEVELVVAHAEACFGIERDWNALMLETLLGPLRSAFAGTASGGVGLTGALLGLDGASLLALPRVRDYLDAVLEPLAARPPQALGAFDGEAGFDVVLAARGHLEEGGASDLRGVLRERLGEAGAGEPRPLELWGERFAPGALEKALTRSRRPRL